MCEYQQQEESDNYWEHYHYGCDEDADYGDLFPGRDEHEDYPNTVIQEPLDVRADIYQQTSTVPQNDTDWQANSLNWQPNSYYSDSSDSDEEQDFW